MTAAVEFTAKSRPGVRLWERPAENAIVKSTGSLPTRYASEQAMVDSERGVSGFVRPRRSG